MSRGIWNSNRLRATVLAVAAILGVVSFEGRPRVIEAKHRTVRREKGQ